MALTYTRRKLSSSAREALYDRCRGDKEFPDCNICGLPVDGVRQPWHESHDPDGPPHCFGGTETGVAHAECNLRHGAEVVRPMDAKATRVRQNFIGASVSRFPMRGGRQDSIKRKIGGGVVPREPRVPKLSFEVLDARLAAVSGEMARPEPVFDAHFEAWLDRVEGGTEGRVGTAFGAALEQCDNARTAFEEGVSAADYVLQILAMRGVQ